MSDLAEQVLAHWTSHLRRCAAELLALARGYGIEP